MKWSEILFPCSKQLTLHRPQRGFFFFYSGKRSWKNKIKLPRQILITCRSLHLNLKMAVTSVYPEAGRKTMLLQLKNCTHTTKCHSQSGIYIPFPLPNLLFFSLISWWMILDFGRVCTTILWPDVCLTRDNCHVLFLIYTSRFAICLLALEEI